MSETPRLRFCNTIYRLRAFSVLFENLWERAIWECARWAGVSTSEKSALSKISSKRKTPIQTDQSFLTWYERKWWVLVTISRKDYSGFHPENDWTSREFLLMESALGNAIKKQFHIFQFDLCTQALKVSAPANFAHFCIIFSGYFMDTIYMSLHWQYSSVLEELEYIKINYVMSPKRC